MGTMPAFLQMERPAQQKNIGMHIHTYVQGIWAQTCKEAEHIKVCSHEGTSAAVCAQGSWELTRVAAGERDAVHQRVTGEVVSNLAAPACSRCI